jgi:enolase
MIQISEIHAREVLDSRGRPTVEVEIKTSTGHVGRAIVPSGASTGRHESLELRDGDPSRHRGRGVLRAVGHVNGVLRDSLKGFDLSDLRKLDARLIALDGTPNKSKLGANATLGVSMAAFHAAAAAHNVPVFEEINRFANANPAWSPIKPTLPMPMVNMISGGLHAGRQIDIQDVLFIPIGATTYHQALEQIVEVYNALADVLRAHGDEANLVGDEGGYGPKLASNESAIERVIEAIEHAGLKPGESGAIGLDVAATHLFDADQKQYRLDGDSPSLAAESMVDRLAAWCDHYPIVSIEDGLAEDDWDGWRLLHARLGHRVQLVGDDLFVTNRDRLDRGAAEPRAANAILIKPNQAGTMTETIDVLRRARSLGVRTVVSARSGETEDTTIADLAVGTAAGQIKIGSVARSERLAKYNQLLRIEETLGRTPMGGFVGPSSERAQHSSETRPEKPTS